MQKQPWFHTMISLLGAIGLLAMASALDSFLTMRQKFAQASFEYDQLFLAQIIVGLLVFSGWLILGWFVLISRRPGQGLSIALLILGAFAVWGAYVFMWVGLEMMWLWLYKLTNNLAQASGIFIAVLGGLGLLYKPRKLDPA